jgi:hypothetical protein
VEVELWQTEAKQLRQQPPDQDGEEAGETRIYDEQEEEGAVGAPSPVLLDRQVAAVLLQLLLLDRRVAAVLLFPPLSWKKAVQFRGQCHSLFPDSYIPQCLSQC